MATVALSGIITPSNVVTATSTATLTNKTISGASNTLTNIPLSTGVTGTLPVANGGTGLTTTPANGALDIGNGTGFTRTTLTAGSGVTITNASGAITIAASGGGSPGGSTTQLQYNNAGAFGGISGVTTDGTRMTASTTIGVGGATPSTSGSGITFPATQNASSNANTLDDYEEGTWTPVMRGDLTAGTYTGTFSGKYTKIGNVVTVTCVAQPSTTASGGSGYFQITGLPFSNEVHSNGSVMFNSVNFTDTAKFLTGQFISPSGQTTIQIKEIYDNATSTDLSIGAFSTSSYLGMTLTYFTS